jgi:hypothetical protein
MSGISPARSDETPARSRAAPMAEAATLRDMVLRQVQAERADRGLACAFDAVARRIGCAPRRVRAWWHNEVKDPPHSEAGRIIEAFRTWLDREEARQTAQLAELRARLTRLDRAA